MNLALSRRGDYVVRSAICLAWYYDAGAPKKVRQISAEMGVPRTFASQILGDLVHAGLAVSSFGTNGGFRLTRPPSQVSLLEVVEAAEGPLAPASCALGESPCRLEDLCPLHEPWTAAADALRSVLAATSLADLAERDRSGRTDTWPLSADDRPRDGFTVAVADSVHVELATAVVAARLRASSSWLVPHFEAASAEGDAIRVRIGPGGPAWLGKTVAVHLGTPVESEDALGIPLAWEATGASGLFPRLEGELRLSSVDPERSEIRLAGHYRPPLGRAGHAIDEALLSHVAHATVRSLLRRVARALEEAETRDPVGTGRADEIGPSPAPAFEGPLTGERESSGAGALVAGSGGARGC